MNIQITFDGSKKINANINGHIVRTDQPVQAGGDNSAPAPYELFLASIGTCAGIYVKSFCDQRGIPTDDIYIEQSMEWDRAAGKMSKMKLDIKLPVDFPEKYKESVIRTAELCAVKKTIQDPPVFEVVTSQI
ncbi:MAG: OsmC family protein [Bacteroidales bacterium]|jgi:ribosomal protein S12 methylthiotransferase accessory factor|nr:OsmC family protein [Bacteroidales bacterium]